MVTATVYITTLGVVRKTADACRRLVALLDALDVEYEKVTVDTPEMREMLEQMSDTRELPQCFVGESYIGTWEEVLDMNEDGKLQAALRNAGYSGKLRGGDDIPVKTVTKKVVVKKVIKKKKEADADDAPPPPPPDDDEDAPPPPPDSDGEDAPPPPPPEDDPPPPPPPEEEAPPPPPDEAIPPSSEAPPPPDDPPPPPLEMEEGDVPPPPPPDE